MLCTTTFQAQASLWGGYESIPQSEGGGWTPPEREGDFWDPLMWHLGNAPNGKNSYVGFGWQLPKSYDLSDAQFTITISAPPAGVENINIGDPDGISPAMKFERGGWTFVDPDHKPLTLDLSLTSTDYSSIPEKYGPFYLPTILYYMNTTLETLGVSLADNPLILVPKIHNPTSVHPTEKGIPGAMQLDGFSPVTFSTVTIHPHLDETPVLSLRCEEGSTTELTMTALISDGVGVPASRFRVDTNGWLGDGAIRIGDASAFAGTLNHVHGKIVLGTGLHPGAAIICNPASASSTLLLKGGATLTQAISYNASLTPTKTLGTEGAGLATFAGLLTIGGQGWNTFITLRLTTDSDSTLAVAGGLTASGNAHIVQIEGLGTVRFNTTGVACSVPTIVMPETSFGGDAPSNSSPTTFSYGSKLMPGGTAGTGGTTTFSGNLDISANTMEGALVFDLATTTTSDKVIVNSGLNVGNLHHSQFTFNTLAGFGAGTYTLFSAPNAPIAHKNIDGTEFPIGTGTLKGSLQLSTNKRSIELVVK